MAEPHAPMVHTEASVQEPGPLTRTVLEYANTVAGLASEAKEPADCAPLAEFVAVDEFERVGAFLERQDWSQYIDMLTQWALAVESFETTVRRISELPGLVYFEIEERHFRGDDVHVVNSMTVFEFSEDGKIRRLAVYLQQPR